jgi:hypothetical protein
MTKRILLAALCFILTTSPAHTQTRDGGKNTWTLISDDDSGFLLLDTARIRRTRSGTVTAWSKFVFLPTKEGREKRDQATAGMKSAYPNIKPEKIQKLERKLILNEYDCELQQSALRQIVFYTDSGEALVSLDYSKEKLSPIVPESVGESLMEAVCKAAPPQQ